MSFSRKHRRHGQPPPRPQQWPPGDTKTTLAHDLEQKPQHYLRDVLIKRAKAGHYHDFETELATPKLTLYKHLLNAGYPDLAQKVRDGGYDHEPPTEEQKDEMMRGLLEGKGGDEP
jgi:hypothetical protein